MKNVFFAAMFSTLLYAQAFAQMPMMPGNSQQDQSFQGFNLQGYTDSGEKSWDVNGDTADIVGSEVKLKNVVANSYGQQKVNVTAENGSIDQISGKMQLEKDVVITNEDGSQLMTDKLDWDRNTDLVTTNDPVLITNETYTVTGRGMEAQPGLKSAKIQEDVIVTVKPEPVNKPTEKVTITSVGPMSIDQQNGIAIFQDDVVATQLDRILKSDRMEVYFNQEMNEIRKMICIGNVAIIQGDNETYAEKAVYDAIAKTLTLTGRPKLIMVTEGEGGIAAP